jgi:predicted nucleic acid-binding protein
VTRFVIGPDVALRLAEQEADVSGDHELLAPTLIRSQLLNALFQGVRRGHLSTEDAVSRLDFVRGLKLRLLGDRVLQRVAWRLAEQLGWEDTYDAEYVALTTMQADAFVTLDEGLADAVRDLVEIATVDDLR